MVFSVSRLMCWHGAVGIEKGNQIVFYCKPSEADNLKSAVVNCINDMSAWMSSHRLKINPTKTEFIWLATSRRNHVIDHGPISISGTQITPWPNVKLLGVHIDEELSLSVQISRTVSSGFFYIRQIKAIRRCLPSDAARSLVNAFTVLLQKHLLWSAKFGNQSPTNCQQYSSKTNYCWCISILTYHTTTIWSPQLAAMYRADTIQTLHDRLQGASRYGFWVPDWAVHSSRRW